MAHKIAFVGNSSQTMCNFRMGAMAALSAQGYEVVVIAPQDSDITVYKQNKIRLIPIDIDCKGMNPLRDIHTAQILRKLYRQEKFDLIFHYTIKPVIYGGWAARRAHIPQISVITGLGYTFLKKGWINRVAKMLYRYSLKSAKEVWFLNLEDKTLFAEQNIVSSFKTRLISGEGVNLTKYKSSGTVSSNPFVFLFVGRVLWDKGVGEYVEAARVVKKQHPKVQFKILGQLGANNPASVGQEQMEAWEQSGAVKYVGETNNVLPYINNANCIVLPSYREGISRVLLEAAAMERPIIASNVPGCREIVVNGENGFLCEPRNTSSLIACMMHMLSLSDEQRAQFGHNGRELVHQRYDEEIIIRLYQDKLKEILHDD